MIEYRTKIRCYCSPAGRNKIADWYNDLAADQAAADAFLIRMQRKEFSTWVDNDDYTPRMSPYEFGELKWKAGQKQHRLFGFFSSGNWYALMGCTHKQRVYDPADAKDTAKKRMKQIERGEVQTVKYDL